jgi:hydrogenase maturation protein HypF
MLERSINAPWTTSAGRLFDAAAALLGLRQISRFEGDAALAVQFAAAAQAGEPFPFEITSAGVVDWRPTIRALLATPTAAAARFQLALSEMIAQVAARLAERCVVLTGGCFQNGLLLETTVRRLENAGRWVFWPQRIPANDGGLALGQIVAAAWQVGREGS